LSGRWPILFLQADKFQRGIVPRIEHDNVQESIQAHGRLLKQQRDSAFSQLFPETDWSASKHQPPLSSTSTSSSTTTQQQGQLPKLPQQSERTEILDKLRTIQQQQLALFESQLLLKMLPHKS
jgi:hypothetical protein